MATLSPVLHRSDSPLLGLLHRQTPQTRPAPPKLPRQSVHLEASDSDSDLKTLLPFRPDSLEASARQCGNLPRCRFRKQCGTVGDTRCRAASQKQGLQRHVRQSIGDWAHVEYGLRRGRGLVKFWHPLSFHWTGTGQVQGLQGAVEHQHNSDVVGAIRVTDSFRPPSASRSQIAREK